MRDLLILAIVAAGCLLALRRPWIGIMLWTWLSLMSPHRFAYGYAYEAPLAAAVAVCTLIGMLMTREKDAPIKGVPVIFFVAFTVWLTASWIFGLDAAGDYWQWNKVIKINFMLLVSLSLLRTKEHIFALLWVTVVSLGLLGAKGGVFTILTAGNFRVWGPPGTFIEDNNEFALAMVLTIPLIRLLHMQVKPRKLKLLLVGAMLLCAASALGSYSRGGMLAIVAMTLVLWWRGDKRVQWGAVLLMAAVVALAFLPEQWFNRMSTIDNFAEDRSALGRISAWTVAWRLAFDHPFGIGFTLARAELFMKYSPYPDYVHAAHSIYFLVLGNHGFIGLFLFLMIGATTWRSAAWLRKHGRAQPESQWTADLGSMAQVSMVGYAVGGAFLSLSYFDLPYIVMVLVVVTRKWVEARAWEREPDYPPGWRTLPGLATPMVEPLAKVANKDLRSRTVL